MHFPIFYLPCSRTPNIFLDLSNTVLLWPQGIIIFSPLEWMEQKTFTSPFLFLSTSLKVLYLTSSNFLHKSAHPYSSGLRLRECVVAVIISWARIRHRPSCIGPKVSKIPWIFMNYFICTFSKPIEICPVFIFTDTLVQVVFIFSPFPNNTRLC